MNACLTRNLAILKRRFPHLCPLLEKSGFSSGLSITTSRSSHPVPQIKEQGRDFPLHSLFDPVKEGEKLLRTYSPGGTKIFLGLGGAYQIRPFMKDSSLLIIEPDRDILRALLSSLDYSDLLDDPRVQLFCGSTLCEIDLWLKNHYTPLLDGNLQVIPLRAYRNREILESIQKGIQATLDEISADCSTQRRLGRQWQRNILNSYERVRRQPFDCTWFGNYKKAIVAAAGPGLEDFLPGLKNREPSTLLLSVDTALPSLLQQGICPDGVITIDPQAIGYLHFMRRLPPSCRIIADWGTPLHGGKGETSYISSFHPLCSYLKDKDGLPLLQMSTGGNVAQAALSLLARGNFTEITLLGADFSYPQAKPYCRESYFHTWFNRSSCRTNSLENNMTGFVLERSGRVTDTEEIRYSSPLMESYEYGFISYLKGRKAVYEKKGKGKWVIRFPRTVLPSPIPKKRESSSNALAAYGRELEKIYDKEDFTPSPLISTLLPLGYAFYEEDGRVALRKAFEYTLNIINRRNS